VKGKIMINARVIARAGVLAVGLGLGGALAATSGMAWADSDFQISIDGQDLFPTTDNSALALSGSGDIAIAYGVNSYADAEGGVGDFAESIGTNTDTQAGSAGAGNYDTAIDIGNNQGSGYGAFAVGGDNDTAMVDAPNSYAISGSTTYDSSLTGSNDTALVLDPFGTGSDYAYSGATDPNPGNFDLAEILFGNGVNAGLATGADHLFDIWSPLGDSVGTAASTEVSNWLTDLLALF
jgi:hypothetical protein